jgi:DNA primase
MFILSIHEAVFFCDIIYSLMSSTVEQIKEKLDIATVVSSYIKLEKAGGNYRARCPFHNEKSPSFFVSPSRETWHCFGCNKGGDIFTFVEEIEGVDFSGALKTLAEKAGVVLDRGNPEERTEKGRLSSLLVEATLFFKKELRKNSEALEYLKKRGLSSETIDEFEIGFAPDEWRVLGDYLSGKGYSEEEQEKSGMSIRSTKPDARSSHYDRFRSRIMFPLADTSGRIVGFSGRIFGKDDPAKYVNSPETPLYNKSKILFGFDKAKNTIRESGACIIVEGQMDLIMAHQAGTKNTVAVSGTALTPYHLENIKRFAEKVILCFDGDEAGIKAAKRTALLALPSGFDVCSVELPFGIDPADIILESVEKWKNVISKNRHIVEFFLDIAERKNLSKRELKFEAEQNVIPLVARIENQIDREHFIDIVSARLSVPNDAVREEVKKSASRQDEGEFLYRETFPEADMKVQKKIPQSRREQLERKIQGVILWQQSLPKPEISHIELTERYKKIGENTPALRDDKNILIFEAETFYGGGGSLFSHTEELFLNFEKEVVKERFAEGMAELRRAEALHDLDKVLELKKRINELMFRMNKLG